MKKNKNYLLLYIGPVEGTGIEGKATKVGCRRREWDVGYALEGLVLRHCGRRRGVLRWRWLVGLWRFPTCGCCRFFARRPSRPWRRLDLCSRGRGLESVCRAIDNVEILLGRIGVAGRLFVAGVRNRLLLMVVAGSRRAGRDAIGVADALSWRHVLRTGALITFWSVRADVPVSSDCHLKSCRAVASTGPAV